MRGIAFLIALILIAHVAPAMAGKKRVGVVMSGDIPYYHAIHSAFVRTLSAQGYTEDRVTVMVQKPAPTVVSWLNAARRYRVLEVDLIVTYGAAATGAAIQENDRIPVVYAAVPDVVGLEFDGKNTTGIRSALPIASLLKYMKRMFDFSSLGVIISRIEPDAAKEMAAVADISRKLGFESVAFDVKNGCTPTGLPDVDMLLMTTSSAAALCSDQFLAAAREMRIPTAALLSGYETNGVVFTVCADPVTQGERIAALAIDILNGRKASVFLPAVAGKKQMIINVGEAKRLGLVIPVELLMSATKLIK